MDHLHVNSGRAALANLLTARAILPPSRALIHRGGLRVWMISDGMIRVGDVVSV